ncbi:hypothetical protein Rhe02_00990 [Rhizocola hellebori]|uniref:Uncharacterized protein n=1 Tax=Rhizocola hellebori TaxID=1392758 RepID=A0A8J3Q252_9ACTN|nr:hypothetical protein [Rhizocola hellebori]GIH02032.1 hypothetical protein Rhe02_00990 [Rhizocola hellebori]
MKQQVFRIGGILLFLAMFGWALWYAMSPPTGPIDATEQGPGLPSACVILTPAMNAELVPNAQASHRTLTRLLSECTLTGGGRELTVKINDHLDPAEAKRSFRTEEEIRSRFNRSFLPPTEHPKLGEQALLEFSFDNTTVKATLIARRDNRVIEVRYTVAQIVPIGRGADPLYYQQARAGAERAAAQLLK